MPDTITKRDALVRLAEWMGWDNDWEMPPLGSFGFSPFTSLDDAFELQARLTEGQWWEYTRELTWRPPTSELTKPVRRGGFHQQNNRACAEATADQRTRAIVRVLFGCEVAADA